VPRWAGFVIKIERELTEKGRILTPDEIVMGRDHPIGPGSKTMSGEDFYVLYILYRQEPTRLLKLRVLAELPHGHDCFGENPVKVVQRRLSDQRRVAGTESCPLRQVPAQEY